METSNVAQALIVLAIISCVTGQRTGPYLYGNTSSVRDGKETVTGIFVSCDSDPMQTVHCTALCQDNSDNDVDALCITFGFEDGDTVLYNSSVHGAPPENITFVGNITCQPEATTLMNCTQDSNSQPFLPDCTEVLVLECFNYLPTSSTGSASSSASPSPSSSSTPGGTDPPTSGTNVGLIAGVSVAAVVVVAAVAVVVAVVGVLVYKNKRKSAVIPISIKPAKS
uniref:SRCR domain-containing protein n=1 Tax=Amphimedon queenslandica TaxID=400682 RepID=A0A1X7UGT3_AMPQE